MSVLRNLAIVTGLLLSACGEARSDEPACDPGNWLTCPKPSLEARSSSWEELRLRLGDLATATEEAVESPSQWHRRLAEVRPPRDDGGDSFLRDWPLPVYVEDNRLRRDPLVDVAAQVTTVFQMFDEGGYDPSSTVLTELRIELMALEGSLFSLGSAKFFSDPFGQSEPRRAIFSYAQTATTLQFFEPPGRVRKDTATRATGVLREQLDAWAQMQRERLAGQPAAAVQNAIDAIGTPEIERLIAAWARIESLPVPSAPAP